MTTDKRFRSLIEQADQPFEGWDFSFIEETNRVSSSLLPWSYGSLAIPLIHQAQSMLDMGTGGGELLSKLQPFPEAVYATEAYPPNVPIAKERLEPLGVQVFQIGEDDQLPFADGQFDLILNRHESYSPKELRRVMKDGGMFLTQQVGGLDCVTINDRFGAPRNEEFVHWNLAYAQQELTDHGFEVVQAMEDFPTQRFYDIGALVYYLKAIEWQVADFSVEKYKDRLYGIHQLINEQGYFDVAQHRFLLLARA